MIEVGTIIERKYRVIELVGTGGMAHVYKAINMSNRRIVALKMLKDEYLNDAEFLRRFSIEASAVLNLSHENIVRAYGVGSYGDIPYIVMEFVDGSTLRTVITQEAPLSPLRAMQLIEPVAAALAMSTAKSTRSCSFPAACSMPESAGAFFAASWL